jgi:eukaryotic-like serine/threonine-protein kinase
MGKVWLAQHLALNAEVVVKLMGEHVADRPDAAARFAREASSAAAIRSPHVVQVFDYGVTEKGTPFIVMELLEGRDLGAWLAVHRKMEPRAVVTLVLQMAKALAKAHRAGVIHRDIKPENIFLCETDGGELFVKLLDFGTAKALDDQQPTAIPTGESFDDVEARPKTNPGELLGTPWYMSPEQIVRAAEVDARADVWSLGVVVFEALTGVKPFDGATVGAIALAVHTTSPKVTDFAPELSPAVDAWFARACARDPNERFSGAREAAVAFVEAITGAPPMEESVPLNAPESVMEPHFPEAKPFQREAPFVAEKLAATLPHPREARRPVMVATTIVIGAALAVMAAVVLRTPPKSAEPAPATTTHAATTHAATTAPPSAPTTTPAATATATASPEPAATTPATVAKVEHPSAPPPPDPRTLRRASGRSSAPTPKKPNGAAPPPLPGPTAAPAKTAQPAGVDDDLARLSNIDPLKDKPAEPPKPAPKPETKPKPETPPAPPPLPAE